AGADLVAGSHPHVLQPLEVLTGADGKQMPVFWSLGNLVSRQDQPDRVLGGLAEFTVRRTPGDTEITDCRLVPVITHQTEDTTSVWLLSDYTESMAAEHRLDVRGLLP
ncbi:MAG: CapA family protein, partial [Stomatobaculum sp.]|nr:CapA family protein [Stomatobaculum sp.]